MQSMGIGGGFVANMYIQQKAYTLNARERAPRHSNIIESKFRSNNGHKNEGPMSIAVPGEVLGYWEMHKRFGSMSWEELIAPTIDICKTGFIMTKHMFDFLVPKFKLDFNFRQMFVNRKTNEFHMAGTRIYPSSRLCKFYRTLAKTGGEDFYNGSLSKLVLDDLKELGSIIDAEDLRKFKITWDIPKKVNINDDILLVTPPPTSSYLVAFILNVLKGSDILQKQTNDTDNMIALHQIVETFKFAYAKRMDLADPDYEDITEIMNSLLSMEYAESVRKTISASKVTHENFEYYGGSGLHLQNISQHGTSHVSIIAPNGDAISITSSINFYFGCGLSGSRTGIVFNSGIDDFSFPNEVNYFNLPPSPRNYIFPQKQAVSSMAPIILIDKHTKNVKIVIGATGGSKIPTAIALTLARILWFGYDVKQAVDAPRIHHQLYPMELEYEYGIKQKFVQSLELLGHKTKRYHQRGSIISAIVRNQSGIFANADFRKRGDVVGF